MSYRGFRGGGGGRRPYGGGPRGRGRGRGGGPYSWNRQENNNERQGGPNPRIIDDDEVMGNDTPTGRPTAPRYTPYGGKPRPRGGRAAMDSAAAGGSSVLSRLGTAPAKSPAGSGDVWYKVLIPHGKKCDKKYLLESLTQHAGPFITENFHFEGNNAIFLVNGRETANALRAASGKFRAPNGFKVTVITTPAPINSGSGGGWNKSNPRIGVVELAPNVVEKLKLCLAKRYDAVSKSLNLSNLFHDEDMTKDDIHLSLGRREVASNVLTIAKENIPQLEILDLSSNRLMSLENLAKLAESLPNITRLNLKNNTLKSTDDLNHLQPLKLEELWLEGNPLCDRFNTDTAYTSVLRKLFPRLKTLDGHELPAAITFEVDALSSLPPTKGNYFANEQVQNLLVRFLNQYFTLYDADNREKLFEAYHENAILSMNVGYNQVLSRQTNFEDYIKENRNLLKAPVHKKDENLKKGRLLVVAFLTKLPLTTHDPNAFTLDVVHVSAASLIFTVYGVFKERLLTKETNKLRTFSRTFVTVPQGDGIVIANELYHITNASPEQQESAFKQAPAPTPSSSPAPTTGVSVEVQLQMVRQFAIDSTMNEDWSRRCLEQNVWDYQKAAACFADLQAKGAIPAEAFQK